MLVQPRESQVFLCKGEMIHHPRLLQLFPETCKSVHGGQTFADTQDCDGGLGEHVSTGNGVNDLLMQRKMSDHPQLLELYPETCESVHRSQISANTQDGDRGLGDPANTGNGVNGLWMQGEMIHHPRLFELSPESCESVHRSQTSADTQDGDGVLGEYVNTLNGVTGLSMQDEMIHHPRLLPLFPETCESLNVGQNFADTQDGDEGFAEHDSSADGGTRLLMQEEMIHRSRLLTNFSSFVLPPV